MEGSMKVVWGVGGGRWYSLENGSLFASDSNFKYLFQRNPQGWKNDESGSIQDHSC